MQLNGPLVPSRYGVLVYTTFQAIDVFGPMDAMNVLAWTHPQHTLAVIADSLAPVTTGNRTGPTGFAESVLPTHTFDAPPNDLEVLFVPGGLGTFARTDPDILHAVDFIRQTYPKLRYLITVCTGAGLAARAGVLDGRNATTNKAAWTGTTALGPKTYWRSHARWVQDGNVWSSSGVSAGIDVTFAWMEAVFGNATATRVANTLEYVRHVNASDDPFADINGARDVPPRES